MKIKNVLKLAVAIAVCELVGVIGSVFTASAIPVWYASVPKPALNPSAWIFGPVWTILYFLMGVSVFLVWRKGLKNKNVRIALLIFSFQLALNALWPIIFFGLRNPRAAFIEIIILWFAILFSIAAFSKISRLAALLLLPYILWVGLAGYLNYSARQFSDDSSAIETCTMEAKLCPDGSYVGRTGSNCAFAPCPSK